MGFFAKGSPGSLLHLTEKSDARGGITDDTIFHSSLPHVFVEKEWTLNTRDFNINWNDSSVNRTMYQGEWGRYNQQSIRDRFLRNKIASMPADLVTMINDPGSVYLVELTYVSGGKEYRKIVSGVSSGNCTTVATNLSQHSGGGFYTAGYEGVISNFSSFAHGIGINIGLFTPTDSAVEIKGLVDGFGTSVACDYGYNLSDMWFNGSNSSWSRIVEMINQSFRRLVTSTYTTYWGGTPSGGLNIGNMVGEYNTPYSHDYNTILISHNGVDCAADKGWGARNLITVSNSSSAYLSFGPHADYGGIRHVSGRASRMMYVPDRGIGTPISPGYDNFNNDRPPIPEWWETIQRYARETRFSNNYPTKVTIYKLNLTYSKTTGYTVKSVATSPAKGIRIGSGKMEVNGVDFLNTGRKSLYQLNKPTGDHASFINGSYSSPSITNKSTIREYATDVSGNLLDLGGNMEPSISNYIGIKELSGTGWGCTESRIFNNSGDIWSANRKPITMLPNSTQRVKIGGQYGPAKNGVETVLDHGYTGIVGNGNNPTTIIFSISSIDPRFIINNAGWFSCGFSNKQDQIVRIIGEMSEQVSMHSLVTVQPGMYTPIYWARGAMTMRAFYYGRPSNGTLSNGLHMDLVLWAYQDSGGIKLFTTSMQSKSPHDNSNWTDGPYNCTVPEITVSLARLT